MHMHSLTRTALPIAGLVCAGIGMTHIEAGTHARSARTLHARSPVPAAASAVACPEPKPIVYIPASNDLSLRDTLKAALNRANTRVILAADVDMDFGGLDSSFFPLEIAECVTFTSLGHAPRRGGDVVGGDPGGGGVSGGRVGNTGRLGGSGAGVATRPRTAATEAELASTTLSAGVKPDGPEARSPRSLGPVLRFGPTRKGANVFFSLRTFPDEEGTRGNRADHVRISGFRIYGPKFGQQRTREVGIYIVRSVDIEIANMEIAGWAEQGVKIDDQDDGPDQPVGANGPGNRIRQPDDIRIHDSYIHHNQHPNIDGHAGGYGLAAGIGAWMRVTHNVFDDNRHSVEASGRSGGYIAEYNLQLKGGGYHGEWYNNWTHPFDVHGTGSNGLGGAAGRDFLFIGNAFQYHKDNAIKIRGQPAVSVMIRNNVFPHAAVEKWPGDGAVYRRTETNTHIGTGNQANVDTFGEYGTCDFDGDAIDDLFLATGRTWWMSSSGEFPWSWLADRIERLRDVRLGYFDADDNCDIMTQATGGAWVISSGGRGAWTPIGNFGFPMAEVVFGQFDPRVRDSRPGSTRRTTDAFRRDVTGQWYVTPLSQVNWQPVGSSYKPLADLRFGDFTGDGVTDVLAVIGGKWNISESARVPWRRINALLGDGVRPLLVANMDADDNIDDLLRVDRSVTPVYGAHNIVQSNKVRIKILRSRNGTSPWQTWQERSWHVAVDPRLVIPVWGFAARFGVAKGGGTMIITPTRHGDFFSAAEVARGVDPRWVTGMAY